MKKLVVLLLSLNALSAQAERVSPSKVPDVIRENFAKTFPQVAKAGWEKEEDGTYEAGFERNGRDMSATFNAAGQLLETESEITLAALPVTCGTYLRQNFRDSRIREVSVLKMADGSTNYEVTVKGFELIFDQGGNFLRAVQP